MVNHGLQVLKRGRQTKRMVDLPEHATVKDCFQGFEVNATGGLVSLVQLGDAGSVSRRDVEPWEQLVSVEDDQKLLGTSHQNSTNSSTSNLSFTNS